MVVQKNKATRNRDKQCDGKLKLLVEVSWWGNTEALLALQTVVLHHPCAAQCQECLMVTRTPTSLTSALPCSGRDQQLELGRPHQPSPALRAA